MKIDDALLARNKLDIGIQTHVRLRRGWTLTEIKTNRIYQGQADTFAEYLSQDDVRSDAKECMDLYNFYIIKHKLLAEDIEDIHYKRLAEAMRAIKYQPERLQEWLDDCRVLSWKDLINKVRETRGKNPMPRTEAITSLPPGSPYNKEWVKQQPCLECLTKPSEPHHWPRTKGAGGRFMIPLCAKHHRIAQDMGPASWFASNNNWRAVANYLDERVLVTNV